MHPLLQRLKELDPKQFELLCFRLTKERHPGVDIKHVDGKAGDEGIDLFLGELAGGPTVWQCKAFPDGVKESQKGQIRESLSRAIRTCAPKRWILCTNVDLDSQAFRWYQDRIRERAGQCTLGLMQASDIVSHLAHYRTLCDEFFPEARMDVAGLRSLLMGTHVMTDAQVAALADETMDQLLLRYKTMDARFNYEAVYARDRVLDQLLPRPAAETFSITKGPLTIKGYARDIEALCMAPPKAEFTLRGEGVRKVMQAIKTGEPQTFGPGEIARFQTDLGPVADLMKVDPSVLTLEWMPSFDHRDPVPLRLTFGQGPAAVVYDYVAFRFKRIGQEEFELVSTTELPFTMSMVFREKEGSFKFTEGDFTKMEVRKIRKFMDAIRALAKEQELEAFALEEGCRLFAGKSHDLKLPSYWEQFEPLLRSVAQIADVFGVNLFLPTYASKEDDNALRVLTAIINESPIRLDSPFVRIVKQADNAAALLETLAKGTAEGVRYTFRDFSIDLFGTTVSVGNLSVELGTVFIQNVEDTEQRWRDAAEGEGVDITFGEADNVILRRAIPASFNI